MLREEKDAPSQEQPPLPERESPLPNEKMLPGRRKMLRESISVLPVRKKCFRLNAQILCRKHFLLQGRGEMLSPERGDPPEEGKSPPAEGENALQLPKLRVLERWPFEKDRGLYGQ
jgi:hypothetical protein